MSSPSASPPSLADAVAVPWSVVWSTLVISMALGTGFYLFFVKTRNKHQTNQQLDLYEKRHFRQAHRSPPAFEGSAWYGWAVAAYQMDDEEALRCMGLDCFMLCRLLRMGFRISGFGVLLSIVLIPIYATGGATGIGTEQFNSITLASVKQASPELWASAVAFCLFCTFCMRSLYVEWRDVYAPRRYQFLAQGDADTETDYRYAVIFENVPRSLRSNYCLREHLEVLFPRQIRQVYVLQGANAVEKLVEERQNVIMAMEKAEAFTKAKPTKPTPQIKQGAKFGCGGTKVDAISFYAAELDRLNQEIDQVRAKIYQSADNAHTHGSKGGGLSNVMNAALSLPGKHKQDDKSKSTTEETEEAGTNGRPASTAFVTFTSLRAKQSAVQCEISGKIDVMDCSAAPIPKSIIWKNAAAPVALKRYYTMIAAAFWTVGALFWAVPVSFVTGLANLNSLLKTFKLPTLNVNTFYYGILSGLLPVVFLQILMIVLYMSIQACAKHFIREKSMSQVDTYTFFWHQIYQFANLWLILLGGSLFNQLDAVLKDKNINAILNLLATALPGASTFFVNMIIMGSFLGFGLELSQLIPWVVAKVMRLLQPEPMQTQRMLDEKNKAPSIAWGQSLPPIVFIFLVTFVYMPIVPLMELFAMVYFGGWYLVWKHNCLHLYAQDFEGGGEIWERLSGFLMACLYTAELVVFAYLGLKKAPGPALFTLIVAVVGTALCHYQLRRNIAGPLRNLSLEVAAKVDQQSGELATSDADAAPFSEAIEGLLYAQPCLKSSADERFPMPYRRGDDVEAQDFTDKTSFLANEDGSNVAARETSSSISRDKSVSSASSHVL